MRLHIRNYLEANRYTVTAGEAIPLGSVIKIVDSGSGTRKAMKLTDSDAASLTEGTFGIAFAVSEEPRQVATSTASARSGDRTLSIASGDLIVQATSAFVEYYDLSLLHDSLNPAEGGTLPAVGDKLEIKDGLLCEAGTTGAITTPLIATVHEVVAGVVTVKITETPAA